MRSGARTPLAVLFEQADFRDPDDVTQPRCSSAELMPAWTLHGHRPPTIRSVVVSNSQPCWGERATSICSDGVA
jgi:hypothetical protein